MSGTPKGNYGAPPKCVHQLLTKRNCQLRISLPRYLNDFSKALASEVRILLQEVGKLRDERRQLQQYASNRDRPDIVDLTLAASARYQNSWL